MEKRRMLTYVVIALIVGAALALAVAVASTRSDAQGAMGASSEATVSGVNSAAGNEELAVADPAKEQPVLDKFTSKDPFIPLPTVSSGGGGTSSSSPDPTSTTAPSNLSAKVKVDGTSYNVMQGDQVPGGSAAEFTVSSVTSGDVTFKVIDGALENGDKSFAVNLGEAVRVTLESGVSYDISVVSIGEGGSGGGSNGSNGSSSSHSISVLSISSQNGTALITIEVDGKTYSDLEQGETVSTSWGEIKIVSINVGAQTVTILHGDQSLNLHAGQVVVK
jgi:hypothetical protein